MIQRLFNPKIIVLAAIIVFSFVTFFQSEPKTTPAYNNQSIQTQQQDTQAFKNQIKATKS